MIHYVVNLFNIVLCNMLLPMNHTQSLLKSFNNKLRGGIELIWKNYANSIKN